MALLLEMASNKLHEVGPPSFKSVVVASTAFRLAHPQNASSNGSAQIKVKKGKRFSKKNSSESIRRRESTTALIELAAGGSLEELKLAIETLGYGLNEKGDDGMTLLHSASRQNQVHIMQYLIESGISLNAKNDDGNTALHIAVESGQIEAMNLLLESGADDTILNNKMDAPLHIACRNNNSNVIAAFLEHPVDLIVPGYRGRTPLHTIAEHDCLEACEIVHNSVIFQGAKKIRLCSQDEDQLTPLHLAARKGSHRTLDFWIQNCRQHGYPAEVVMSFLDEENSTPLHAAVDAGNTEVVKVFLKHGGSPLARKDEQPSPLHLACSQGRLEIVKAMVEHCGKDILQENDQYSQSSLHYSAPAINSGKMISYLIQQGAIVNVRDNQGRTALHIAIISGSLAAVQELLSSGADPFIKDQHGSNSLHYAINHNRKAIATHLLQLPLASHLVTDLDNDSNSPVHLALKLGVGDMIGAMVSIAGAQLQTTSDNRGNNFLHLAALAGNYTAMSVLLDNPSCRNLLNEMNVYGCTPLHMAARTGHTHCAELLLNQGAVSHRCYSGVTQFLAACLNGNAGTARVLFQAHPYQREWTDDNGNTALHLATMSGNPATVHLALDLGVPVTLNFNGKSFLDIMIEKVDRKSARIAMQHKRWQECLDVWSPLSPPPMISLIVKMPDVAQTVLDHCHTKAAVDPRHRDYWEEFNFKYLRLVSTSASDSQDEDDDLESTDSHSMITSPVIRYRGSIRSATLPSYKTPALPLMGALQKMVQYNRVDLLTHPVVDAYLKSKWTNYGCWVYLATYILVILQAIFLAIFIIISPDPSLRTSTNATAHTDNASAANFTLSGEANAIHILILVLNVISTLNEIFRLVLLIKIQARPNSQEFIWCWCCCFMIICTFIFLIPSPLVWEAGALAAFFAWFAVAMGLQYFNLFGIYISMFVAVTRTILRVLLICLILLIAFSLSLHILAGSLLEFSNIGYSLFTNFGYMLGEIQYALFVRSSEDGILFSSPLTLLFITTLAILMSIVMINLLIGLAVGDIEKIQMNAVVERARTVVQLFVYIDSLLPQQILNKFDRASHRKYSNASNSSVRKLLCYFWRTCEEGPLNSTRTSSSVTIQDFVEDIATIKQQLTDLTFMIKRLQEERKMERSSGLSEFEP